MILRTPPSRNAPTGRETVRLTIAGMTGEQCADAVSRALKEVHGVRDAVVSYGSQTGLVDVEPTTCAEDLVKAVASAGPYTVRSQRRGGSAPMAEPPMDEFRNGDEK